MNFKERLKRTLVVLLLPMISYGILGPLEIFGGNQKDFEFGFADFFWIFLGISVGCWIVGSLILAAFPDRINRFLNSLILGVGVASYIQNMFMNIKLSEANGSPMNWEELGNFPIINFIIWLVIIVFVIGLCVILKKRWNIVSMGLAAFLSVIQLVAVFSLVVTIGLNNKSENTLALSGNKQFKVAPNQNIVVLVLDSFGNTQLENALMQNPSLLDGLSDFTFYDNMDCHYYCTFPSMTHLFTGEEFDFDAESSFTWMEEAWKSEKAESFFKTLKSEEYTCNLFATNVDYVYGNILNLQGKFDNVQPMQKVIDESQLTKLLGKVSIYRYVPYLIKPRFEVLTSEFGGVVSYEGNDSCIEGNGEFYQGLTTKKVSVDPDMNNAMIIQELFGTHPPYTTDANAGVVEESSLEDVIKGLMVMVNEYLDQMKAVGVYDNATIIITADHGSWNGGDSQPVFFIKKAHETHTEVEVNSAPVSLDDFQATVMSVLGVDDYSEFGKSIFDWKEGDERERSVYMRITDEEYPSVEGSPWNVYYGYTYFTDKKELNEKISNGPDEIQPATPWPVIPW